MASHDLPGGTYRVGDLELTRVGYGAMQLAGPGVFGPPKDRDEAIAVLREAGRSTTTSGTSGWTCSTS